MVAQPPSAPFDWGCSGRRFHQKEMRHHPLTHFLRGRSCPCIHPSESIENVVVGSPSHACCVYAYLFYLLWYRCNLFYLPLSPSFNNERKCFVDTRWVFLPCLYLEREINIKEINNRCNRWYDLTIRERSKGILMIRAR